MALIVSPIEAAHSQDHICQQPTSSDLSRAFFTLAAAVTKHCDPLSLYHPGNPIEPAAEGPFDGKQSRRHNRIDRDESPSHTSRRNWRRLRHALLS